MGASTSTQRWALGLTATAAFMVALDQLVVATALDRIRADLHASMATLDWTVNAFSISVAVLLITAAALGDRFGRRRMFVVGIGLFTASSAACALAPNAAVLVAARTLQGAGGAFVLPLSVALLTAAYPPERRGPVVGLFTGLTGLAVAGGPVVGGAVAQGLAWQWIFWLNVPIGLVLIPLVLAKLPASTPGRARLDPGGVVLVTGATLGLVWGLIRAADAGWTSPEVVGTLLAGAVLGVAFVAWERRTRNPMVQLHLFWIRAFSAGNAAVLMLTASLFSSVFLLAQYLQISLGYGPLAAGLGFLPWTGMVLLVAPLSGVLLPRVGGRALLALGLLLQGVGLAWVAANVATGAGYPASVVALILAGCGTSLALPAGQNTVMNAVPPAFLGQAAGTYNTVRQLGGVLGIAVISAVFAAHGSYASPGAYADGVAPAEAVAAGLAVVGALVATLVPGRRRPQPPTAPREVADAVVG